MQVHIGPGFIQSIEEPLIAGYCLPFILLVESDQILQPFSDLNKCSVTKVTKRLNILGLTYQYLVRDTF